MADAPTTATEIPQSVLDRRTDQIAGHIRAHWSPPLSDAHGSHMVHLVLARALAPFFTVVPTLYWRYTHGITMGLDMPGFQTFRLPHEFNGELDGLEMVRVELDHQWPGVRRAQLVIGARCNGNPATAEVFAHIEGRPGAHGVIPVSNAHRIDVASPLGFTMYYPRELGLRAATVPMMHTNHIDTAKSMGASLELRLAAYYGLQRRA